jgi:hypothetical protein
MEPFIDVLEVSMKVVCVHERTASRPFLLTTLSQGHYNSFRMHERACVFDASPARVIAANS